MKKLEETISTLLDLSLKITIVDLSPSVYDYFDIKDKFRVVIILPQKLPILYKKNFKEIGLKLPKDNVVRFVIKTEPRLGENWVEKHLKELLKKHFLNLKEKTLK